MLAPTSNPRDPSNRGKALVWILVLLVVAGAAFAIYWFALRGGGGGGASATLASSVVPTGADTVAGIDAGALLANPELADLMQKGGLDLATVKSKLAETGVKLEDLKSFVVAADMPDAGAPEVVLALQTTADTKAAQGAIAALKSMIPDNMGNKIDISNVQAFDGGIVLAGAGPFFDEASKLAKGQGKGGLSEPLAEVRSALDAGAPLWVALTIPADVTKGMGGMMAKKVFGEGKPTHAGLSVRLGSTIELKGAIRIEGADASKVASNLSGLLSMAGMVAKGPQKELLNNVELGSSGSTLTISVSMSADQAKKLAESDGLGL